MGQYSNRARVGFGTARVNGTVVPKLLVPERCERGWKEGACAQTYGVLCVIGCEDFRLSDSLTGRSDDSFADRFADSLKNNF
jgi:hypothetical protein